MRSTKALCVHLHSLLNGSIPKESVESLIGRVGKLDGPTYLSWSKDMNLLMRQALTGNLDQITQEQLFTIGLRLNVDHVKYWSSTHNEMVEPMLTVKDRSIREILSLPYGHYNSDRIWSGLMRLKTLLINEDRDLSSKDIEEIKTRINTPFSGSREYLRDIQPKFRKICESFIDAMMKRHADLAHTADTYEVMTAMPNTPKMRFSVGSKVKTSVSKHMFDPSLVDLRNPLRHPLIFDLFDKYPKEFMERTTLGGPSDFTIDPSLKIGPDLSEDLPLGEITLIHELGLKSRVVYIPTPSLQSITHGVGRLCTQLCKYWEPVQGVKGHSKAQEHLRRLIQKGRYVFHSMDYSSFTDRFPFEGIQDTLLTVMQEKGLITPLQHEAVRVLCHGKAKAFNDIIAYLCGTPMGSFPSFPLASLCHGLVLTMAFLEAHPLININQINWNMLPFIVIGDDSCIYDEPTFAWTQRIMSKECLDVPLQMEKVLTSPRVANLCSHTVTVNGIFEQKKLKPLLKNSIQDALTKFEYYGRAVLDYYDPIILEAIYNLGDVLRPYGLKVNTRSTPYERARAMVEELDKLAQKPKRGLSSKELQLLTSRKDYSIHHLLRDVEALEHTEDRRNSLLTDPMYRSTVDEYDKLRTYLLDKARPADIIQLTSAVEELKILKDRLLQLTFFYGVKPEDLVGQEYSFIIKKEKYPNAVFAKRMELESSNPVNPQLFVEK